MNQLKHSNGKRIGLFDSGVGGLSILRSLQENSMASNRDMRFIYLGDTGRCPYGDRSPAEISSYVDQIVSWFNGAGVERIVMACNTSAAVAAPLARRISSVPVHDLISSAAKFAANNFQSIGVIATSTTCRSKAFSQAIKETNPGARVIEIPCPDLVPLVEKGLLEGDLVDATIAKYVSQLKEFKIDSLIFGCTHFPFLEAAFRKQLPDSVSFVDPALHLSLEVLGPNISNTKQVLGNEVFQRNIYFSTGDPESFGRAAELCLKLSEGALKNAVCALNPSELQIYTAEADLSKNTVILKSPFANSNTSSK